MGFKVSNLLPIQFWLNGKLTFNQKGEPGVEQLCFNTTFNCSDSLHFQWTDTISRAYKLRILDSDGATIATLNSAVIGPDADGNYTYYLTTTANAQGICNEIVSFVILWTEEVTTTTTSTTTTTTTTSTTTTTTSTTTTAAPTTAPPTTEPPTTTTTTSTTTTTEAPLTVTGEITTAIGSVTYNYDFDDGGGTAINFNITASGFDTHSEPFTPLHGSSVIVTFNKTSNGGLAQDVVNSEWFKNGFSVHVGAPITAGNPATGSYVITGCAPGDILKVVVSEG